MVSLESTLANTLRYSAQFNYPLTSTEVWFWQIETQYSKSKISTFLSSHFKSKSNFYYLSPSHVVSRLNNKTSSQFKWGIAKKYSEKLKRIPFILAIFVTGALAMNNSPKDDDIDLMIITYPHTLWITRLLVLLILGKSRRPSSVPEHSSSRVSNKICDNLYLTSSSLLINTQNLYTAHEVLQAQCLYDAANITSQFIYANPWVKKYLPQAFKQQFKNVSINSLQKDPSRNYSFLSPINLMLFKFQYLYMHKKITNEKISLNFAFFHPRNNQKSSNS